MTNLPITQSEIEESLIFAVKLLGFEKDFGQTIDSLKKLKISSWNTFKIELDKYLDSKEKNTYSFNRCTGEAFYELLHEGITPKRKSAAILALFILLKNNELTDADLAIFSKNSKFEKGISNISNRYHLLRKLKSFLDYNKETQQAEPLKIDDNIQIFETKILEGKFDLSTKSINSKKKVFQYIFATVIFAFTLFLTTKYHLKNSISNANQKADLHDVFKINSYSNNKQAPCKINVEYDLRNIKFDSAFIDFGDNIKHKLIKSNGNISHTITHAQGRYVTLYLDTLEIKKHITINSKGWFTKVDNLYVIEDNLVKNGIRYLPQKKVPPQIIETGQYVTAHQNIQDFKIDGDNMTFETRVKNPFAEGGINCFDVSIDINGRINDSLRVLSFNLLGDKCDEWAKITVGDVHIEGDSTILNKSRFDLSTWRIVKVKTESSIMKIFVDKKMIYTIPYKQKIGNIIFLQILFKGTGSIDYVKLYDNKSKERGISYIENF